MPFLRTGQVATVCELAEEVAFARGDMVYRRGMPATYLYVIADGRIALLAPGAEGLDALVNELGVGELFGACVCLDVPSYTLTARCAADARLLEFDAEQLKGLMDGDVAIGYALQAQIAKVYFRRYADSMKRLSGILTHIGVSSPVASP